MNERGQAVPVVVGVVAVIAVLVAALGVVAGHAVDAARARTAADAAALAGVESGPAVAESLAAANGASLVDFRVMPDGDVLVRARVGTATAVARATLERVAVGGLAGSSP